MAKRITPMVLGAALTLGGLFALAPAVADAQSARGRQPRVIQLDEIRIEGRVQKPNAFYILNRSNLGYEVLDLRTSFVREVIRSVQDEPF
ncbi:MAG TPA: hypothetical protein RMH99_11350 [Sandaracinaceae bacterium LLY-WYZ-13_1]|nr:hypothetical protein [Sandaracinaceae bacterium LLY-WYZ-13_1]